VPRERVGDDPVATVRGLSSFLVKQVAALTCGLKGKAGGRSGLSTAFSDAGSMS
jgi:hypothetical protein